ncbi:predicted protein [Postia placenta Mad-698-R]|nr:predicted protein [Postia placenta Mad-698-R]
MGVLGLTPFLIKICPEVIKTLPDRLRALRGKTVVIDGTLITQRLHFAPMPHKYRHVLGWYRIVKELRECDVHAICVFDGTQRSVAKEAEAKRRKSVRRTAAARSALETDRLKRLRKLGTLVQKLRGLKDSERQRLADILRTLVGTLADEPDTAEILFNDFKQPSATTEFNATLADSSHDDLSIVADEEEGMAEEESMDEEDADEGEAEAEDAIDQEDANHLRLENLSLEDRSPIKEPSEVIDSERQ